MKIKNHLIPALLLSFVLHSCSVSKKRIAAMRESNISDFSLANFNGYYAMKSNFCSEKIANTCGSPPSLWEALYSCKTMKDEYIVKAMKGDSLKFSNNAIVNLNFDGKQKLTVSLFDSGKIINQIELKARVFKNNLAVKKNLFLIPIPIFFYVRHERKVLLGNNSDKSLNVGFSKIT